MTPSTNACVKALQPRRGAARSREVRQGQSAPGIGCRCSAKCVGQVSARRRARRALPVTHMPPRHAASGRAMRRALQRHVSDLPMTSGQSLRCWAEAPIKIARMTLTIKLDRNWSSFQLANSAPPLSVTDSAIAPSARMPAKLRAEKS